MRRALFLFFACFWYGVAQLFIGCAPKPFPIGNGVSITSIKIEPNHKPKSVYKVERHI